MGELSAALDAGQARGRSTAASSHRMRRRYDGAPSVERGRHVTEERKERHCQCGRRAWEAGARLGFPAKLRSSRLQREGSRSEWGAAYRPVREGANRRVVLGACQVDARPPHLTSTNRLTSHIAQPRPPPSCPKTERKQPNPSHPRFHSDQGRAAAREFHAPSPPDRAISSADDDCQSIGWIKMSYLANA